MLKRFGPLAASALTAIALAGCGQVAGSAAGEQAKNVITVAETPAIVGNVASLLSYSGSVAPRWTVNIMPKTQGLVMELKAQQGQRVNRGDVLAVLDHRALDDQVAQAQANVSAAQAKLNSLLAGARPEDIAAARASVAAAEAAVQNLQQGRGEAVAQAQAKLDADQAALNKLLNGPAAQDITNARLAVEQAKDKLWADQVNYDAQVGRGAMTKEQRESALSVDQTAIDQANTQLAKLVAPPRAEDVAQLKAAVDADKQAVEVAKQPGTQASIAQAQQQANAAKANAAKAASPYTPEDIQQARAQVEVAQAAARSAQTVLEDATITAPSDGVLSDVPIAVGSLVSPQAPVATLMSLELEVDVSVEESQVAVFKEGQAATISVAAAKPIDGKVFLVAPSADAKTRKFAIKVTPAVADSPLRAGMSAAVKVQTGQQQDAILVPKDAVIQRNGRQIVFIDQGGRAKMVAVETGLTDDRNVQILNGVQANQLVILPGSVDLADGDAVQAAPAPAAAR